jgi:NAD(P)-dependent dehydrogenase (short-subunit alcohol dehydrogenase family)
VGEDKHVLISGGAGDLGTAIGVTLAASGHAVTLADRRAVGDATAALSTVAGARYRQVDVCSRAEIDAMVDDLPEIHAVVGGHGIVRSSPFNEITADDWQAQVNVNLTGAFHLGQAVTRRWCRDGRPGSIVFIGSWVGEVPWPEIAAYSVSKAGLQMLARCMARELASSGIRVNVIAPGIVDAGMARHQARTEPQYAARIEGIVPLGRLQTPEEVAAATAFLLSPAAAYITGSTLLADGGTSLFNFAGDL